MSVTNLSETIQADLALVWERRSTAEDKIEYATSIQMVETDEGDHEMALTVYASLACPESGPRLATTAIVVVPLKAVMATGAQPLATNIWERLVSSRMVHSAGLSEMGPDTIE